ncbi:MAG: 2-oxoacid:acceptor oxidoreductase family protein [Candidatus Bipolaricaulaceae bacterium]
MGELRLRLSGIGGQGIVFAGRLLAQAMLEAGKEVTLRYTYGAEVMGTPVHSDLVIADEPILSPYFREAQVAVILHPRALPEAMAGVERGGLVVLDSSCPPPAQRATFRLEMRPFLEQVARRQPGDPGRLAAVAALGFLAKLGVLPREPLTRTVETGPSAEENRAALRLGLEL